MAKDPEIRFDANRKQISFFSSFRSLALICAMGFMLWIGAGVGLFVYCDATGNCLRAQGDDGGDDVDVRSK